MDREVPADHHGLALMRYGLLSNASGLHDTWGAHNATLLASLSLAVVAMFALALTMVSVRVFSRSALR